MMRTISKMESIKQLNKKYVKDNLEEIILRMSLKGSVYGYELLRYLKEEFGNSCSPSELYPTLWGLEKQGYLSSEEEIQDNGKRRRVYHPVNSKTVERLREIRYIKNQNRRKINGLPAKVFTVQFSEPPLIEED